MRGNKRKGVVGLVDLATGERLGELEFRPYHYQVGGRFMKLYQEATRHLNRHSSLRAQSYRVLIQALSLAGWENKLPTSGAMAAELGMRPSNASRAYRPLVDNGFFVRKDRAYYLSPILCWKGNEAQYEVALRGLYDSHQIVEPQAPYLIGP